MDPITNVPFVCFVEMKNVTPAQRRSAGRGRSSCWLSVSKRESQREEEGTENGDETY